MESISKGLMDNFIPIKQKDNVKEVLSILLDDSNLELKSHIVKPKHLSILKVLAQYFKSFGLKKSSEIIENFITIFLKYMISFNRLSRKEIISAIQNLEQEKKDFTKAEQLIRNLK